MKIPLETISPKVYSFHDADGWHYLLACENRIFKIGRLPLDSPSHGKILGTKNQKWKIESAWEKMIFPAVVGIPIEGVKISKTKTVKMQFGVDAGDCRLSILEIGTLNLTEHSARVAIAEAWRGVDHCHVDCESMSPVIGYDMTPFTTYKNGSAWWMVNAWIRWDDWNRRGLKMPQRAKELESLGFSVSAAMLKNAADVRGMPKAIKDDPIV
jgi:hypothetical protein